MIRYHIGDATQPGLDGEVTIAHVLSDTPAYDAGFAKALGDRHPLARQRFKAWARGDPGTGGTHRSFRLGAIQFVGVGHDLGRTFRFSDRWVVNMVAQRGLRSADNPHPLDLDALDQCLRQVAEYTHGSIVMPRIGCGLAGGTWDEVEPLIEVTLKDHDVHIYDLPEGGG